MKMDGYFEVERLGIEYLFLLDEFDCLNNLMKVRRLELDCEFEESEMYGNCGFRDIYVNQKKENLSFEIF